MTTIANQLMTGALAMALIVAALFFFRYWRETRDRLFALFALSYVVMAADRLAHAFYQEVHGDPYYWIRLAAFVIIILAIVDKNRSRPAKPDREASQAAAVHEAPRAG
ncbi:MAG: hypothetical protein HYS13_08295 [Planctomycetia bacterium]|nr:hypothetical protein [Planctomycetia bacterium]